MALLHCDTLFPFLVNMTLVILADSIASSALGALTDPSSLQPGFWNIGTNYVILTSVADLIGQLFLGYLADSKGIRTAFLVNISSVFLASVFSLISLTFSQWPILATVVAPLLKTIGGGSHATAFLILVPLQSLDSKNTQATLIYYTGALNVISQSIGSFVTPRLATKNKALPYALSMLCCLLSYSISILYQSPSTSSQPHDAEDNFTESDPLLNPGEATLSDDQATSKLIKIKAFFYENAGHTILSPEKNRRMIVFVFFLAAISKATRPLFMSYIQHRDAISPAQAQRLWLLRSVLSVIIFALILPLITYLLQSRASIPPAQAALYAARISIVFMETGALIIGLAESFSALIPALIINTLGVGTDLALLIYLANLIRDEVAGRVIMLTASLESAGALVGIAILYPIYQWSMNQSSLAGGVAYYMCAAIYAVAASLIWTMRFTPNAS